MIRPANPDDSHFGGGGSHPPPYPPQVSPLKSIDYSLKESMRNINIIATEYSTLIRVSKKKYYYEYFEINLKNMKNTWDGINDLIN